MAKPPKTLGPPVLLRARRMLDVGLVLVRDLMGVKLPVQASEHVDRDPTARVLAREVRVRLLSGDLGMLARPQEVRFHLRARERLLDRIRYALRLATTQIFVDAARQSHLVVPVIPRGR